MVRDSGKTIVATKHNVQKTSQKNITKINRICRDEIRNNITVVNRKNGLTEKNEKSTMAEQIGPHICVIVDKEFLLKNH